METINPVSFKPKLAVGDEQACIVAWNKANEGDVVMMVDLDKICCEFAGIAPIKWKLKGSDGRVFDHPNFPTLEDCQAYQKYRNHEEPNYTAIAEYPPVSTSWFAAGQLMEALRPKRVNVAIEINWKWPIRAKVGTLPNQAQVEADTGPMALALAVQKLATETK